MFANFLFSAIFAAYILGPVSIKAQAPETNVDCNATNGHVYKHCEFFCDGDEAFFLTDQQPCHLSSEISDIKTPVVSARTGTEMRQGVCKDGKCVPSDTQTSKGAEPWNRLGGWRKLCTLELKDQGVPVNHSPVLERTNRRLPIAHTGATSKECPFSSLLFKYHHYLQHDFVFFTYYAWRLLFPLQTPQTRALGMVQSPPWIR